MKSFFTLLVCLLAQPVLVSAQQSYCTTDLYFDGLVCKIRPQTPTYIQYHLGIRDFILQGHANSKIIDTATACGSSNGGQLNQPGYSDRTFITPVELRRDSTYTITVKQEQGVDSEGVGLYSWFPTWVAIDFNNNFAFDTAASNAEFVIVRDIPNISTSYDRSVYNPNGAFRQPTPIILSFRIKIPANAPYGIHRLRIRSLAGFGSVVQSPCFKSGDGETQDYLVKIVEVPAAVGSLAPGANRFSLAPNPATTSTTLQIPPGSAATEAQLLDVQGRICATQRAAAGTTTLSFATDALPAGLYFVKVTETGQPPVVLKLVK